MRRALGLLLFIIVVSPPTVEFRSDAQETSAETSSESADSTPAAAVDTLEQQLGSPAFGAQDAVAATGWVQSTGVVDWLGPLAPVALSPFFGVTCLSGLALWGPEWAADNALFQASGPLQSRTLFFVFLGLTVLTSVPRLTKVSKPFAQAVDRLETYSVILILLLIKILAPSPSDSGEVQVAMVQLGVLSFTLDTLLALAMVINILVINSVKFFFEFMVWLTPIPFLDAVFEVCNKTVCAALMAIYAFSPTLATVLNLIMLVLAAIVLRWISRRVRFYRTMVLDPVIARMWRGFGKPRRPELIVFPNQEFGPFAAKSRLRLCRSSQGDGWLLREANWWMPAKEHKLAADVTPQIRRGWVMHAIEVGDQGGEEIVLSFSRRYDAETLQQLVKELGMEMSETEMQESESMALKALFG